MTLISDIFKTSVILTICVKFVIPWSENTMILTSSLRPFDVKFCRKSCSVLSTSRSSWFNWGEFTPYLWPYASIASKYIPKKCYTHTKYNSCYKCCNNSCNIHSISKSWTWSFCHSYTCRISLTIYTAYFTVS